MPVSKSLHLRNWPIELFIRTERKVYTEYHGEPDKYVYHLALKIRHI